MLLMTGNPPVSHLALMTSCALKLSVDPTVACGAVHYGGFLVAVYLNNCSGEDDKLVKIEWGTSGKAMVLSANDSVVAEGSEAVAAFLFQNNPQYSAETADSKFWLDFALTRLTGDFAKLSAALNELNERLKYQTFIVEGVKCCLVDVIAWCQLRASPVFLKLAKGAASSLTVEVIRWFNYMSDMPVIKAAVDSWADMQKQLRGRQKDQASFEINLEGAEMGKVVTRFPPEPSGYLHIGHAKAVLLNQYFAQAYKGKLIIRFDDTNPSKEKCEFEQSILEDLELLGVRGDVHSHTSDHFKELEAYCEQMLREGTAYADDTPQEQMREERFHGIDSQCRANSPEESLRRWGEMKQGTEAGLRNCIRAKIDMQALNKALRDPVIYRCNVATPHHRTGSTFKVYPTYDFACPIVDSLEGVTHALRTNEYHDRNDQYAWFIKTLKLRPVAIWDFARLNFVYTLLSKRKLTWFVDTGRVGGWDDPRFPTVRGIRRRGLTIEALREYILMQGPSKNTILLEWDKLWAVNKKVIDPIAPRFVALNTDHLCRVTLLPSVDVPEAPELRSLPRHKKNAGLGSKDVAFSSHLFLEQADAAQLAPGVEFTLMDWGNAVVESIERVDAQVVASVKLRLNLAGDFKTTKLKATWLSPDPNPLLPIALHDYDYLITKKRLDEEDTLDDCLTPVSEFITSAIGDSNMSSLKAGDIIQIERKGFYIVDKAPEQPTISNPIRLIAIPDGKAKSIASKHS